VQSNAILARREKILLNKFQ